MKRRFTKLMAALALLLLIAPPLVGWGQTRTETTLLSEDFSSITAGNNTSTSGSNTTWDGNTNFPTLTSAYKAGGAVRLGTGSGTGSITSKSLSVNAGTLTVSFDVKGWTSVEGNIKVTVGSQNQTVTYTAKISDSFQSKSVNFAISQAGSMTVKLETTAKRAFLDNIVITNTTSGGGGGSTPTITIPEEELSLGYEENEDGAFDVSYTNFTAAYAYAVLYSDATCQTLFPTTGDDAWIVIDVDNNELEDPTSIGYILDANPNTTPRTVYLQIYAYEANYSNYLDGTFEITQAGMPAPAPYINLVADAAVYTPVDAYHMEFSYNVSGGGPIDNVEYGNFQSTLEFDDFDIQFCDVNGDPLPTQAAPDWFMNDSPKVAFYEPDNTISLYVEVLQNETANDRYCYFKVYAANGNEWVYSDLVTVHQTGMPQVATPTFNPAAGEVEAGTTVAVSCDTEGAAIQYSTDNGTTWTNGTTVTITEAVTIQAKATLSGYADSDVATASYTVRGNAEFTDGVYEELMTTEASFNNMQVVSVTGEGTWTFSTSYNCAFIKYSDAQEDWLITPKMHVDNGKLNVGFSIWHKNLEDNGITLKWSNTNSTTGTWNDVTFDKQGESSWRTVSNLVIETGNAENVYLAFVFANTNTSNAQCEIKNLKVRQYYNVTFDANVANAQGTMAAQSIPAGLATALTENAFTATGKVFTGWNTAAVGTGTAYADGASITITANTTLYAQWADTYTVNFTTNGIADGTIEVIQGQAISTLPTATAEYIPAGYAFIGWLATDIEGVSETAPEGLITAPYTPQGDVTLKAVFAEATGSQSTVHKSMTLKSTDSEVPSFGNGYNTRTFTKNNISFTVENGMKSGDYFQLNKNTGKIYNTTPLGTTITSITATIGVNSIIVYEGTSSNPAQNTITGSNNEYSFTNGSNYFTITSTTKYTQVYFTVNYDETTSTYNYSNYRTSLLTNASITVDGYAEESDGGYKLIATPVYVSPSTVTGMTTDEFDLYYFDEAQDHEEWRNYKASSFNLVPGKGYLYAKLANSDDPYEFTFSGTPYNGDGEVALSYTEGNQRAGWNLIGNPYAVSATLNKSYYRLNEAGDALNAYTESTDVAAMEGVFVQATAASQTATFEAQSRGGKKSVAKVELTLNGNKGIIDNAIVRFDEGQTLEKFMLNANDTKLYFTEGNQDYAIVRSDAQGEMPVNFKASKNGSYTISVNAENTEMNYLHLIDNMTGADIDLLATPSYSFEAKTSDYASRFRLVFNANNGSNENGNETFAYYNGSEWMINNMGDATLQVIDVMGRVLSSETVSGNATINLNQMPGVYMLRLVNGDSVKVQKVVVR